MTCARTVRVLQMKMIQGEEESRKRHVKFGTHVRNAAESMQTLVQAAFTGDADGMEYGTEEGAHGASRACRPGGERTVRISSWNFVSCIFRFTMREMSEFHGSKKRTKSTEARRLFR